MVIAFLIYEGQFPSMYHARYLDENECKIEVERLNQNAVEHNKRIEEHPATGKGSCFLNIKQELNRWSYQRKEFPR